MSILLAIKRYVVILVAYALAALVAGYGVVAAQFAADGHIDPLFPFLPYGGFASMVIALWAAIPAILFVMLMEWRRWRAIWIYCGFAMFAGFALGCSIMIAPWFPVAGLALGALSGGTYWAIAGRNAGHLGDTEAPYAQAQLLGLLGFSAAVLAILLANYYYWPFTFTN